ncbi:MAG: WYL domain-containing protein, partial [Victivallales bacterium]|nr:WYL domain-containing protein [Victivallales bacterium]
MKIKKQGIPAEERLMNLSAFLLRRRSPVTLREALREVGGYDEEGDSESNRRKFMRDKKELASLGINVISEKIYDDVSGRRVDGYYIDPDEYYLQQINFTADEAKALSALETQIFDTGSAPFRELHWALMKIEASSDRRRSDAQQSRPGTLLVHFDGDWKIVVDTLGLVIDAVAARRTISVKYSPANSDASSRELDPYGLFLRRGFWYLCAFCHLRG